MIGLYSGRVIVRTTRNWWQVGIPFICCVKELGASSMKILMYIIVHQSTPLVRSKVYTVQDTPVTPRHNSIEPPSNINSSAIKISDDLGSQQFLILWAGRNYVRRSGDCQQCSTLRDSYERSGITVLCWNQPQKSGPHVRYKHFYQLGESLTKIQWSHLKRFLVEAMKKNSLTSPGTRQVWGLWLGLMWR